MNRHQRQAGAQQESKSNREEGLSSDEERRLEEVPNDAELPVENPSTAAELVVVTEISRMTTGRQQTTTGRWGLVRRAGKGVIK